jgi:type VI protein secretion system component VasF
MSTVTETPEKKQSTGLPLWVILAAAVVLPVVAYILSDNWPKP